ncbi:hypothetical protein D027_2804A, partial [Vibrio parahaemolyticus 861]|jgi:hypothetical protein
MHP